MIFNNGARRGVADATVSSSENKRDTLLSGISFQFYPLSRLNRALLLSMLLLYNLLNSVVVKQRVDKHRSTCEYHAHFVMCKICTKQRRITKKCLACNLAENDWLTPSFETGRRHQSGSLKKRRSTLFLFPRG